MSERIEIWFCSDCMHFHETGDATSFDWNYCEDEAEDRLTECEAGLDSLAKEGNFFNDSCDESTHQCVFCGFVIDSNEVVATGEDLDEHICPSCGKDGLQQRSSGYDEFSRQDCDACGTDLAGSRHRYQLLPTEEIKE